MDELGSFSPISIKTKSGFVSFAHLDFPLAVGGIRMEPGVTALETEKLAISMALKLSTYMLPFTGAKAGINNRPYDKQKLDEFIGEIAPLLKGINLQEINNKEWEILGRLDNAVSTEITFVTGPDMGTSEEGFLDSLRNNNLAEIAREGLLSRNSESYGLPLDNVLTGYGVVVAIEETFSALETSDKNEDPLHGKSYCLEGFGKVASGIAALLDRRCKLKAISNRHGTIVADKESSVCDGEAFDVELILDLFRKKGDDFIFETGLEIQPLDNLFEIPCDFLVPGTRVERINQDLARKIEKAGTRAIVPSANFPFTYEGRKHLEKKGIMVIPDFVANAGAVIAAMLEFTTRPIEGKVEEAAMDLVHAAISNEMRELFLDAVACGCRIGDSVMGNEKSIYDISIERSLSKLDFMKKTVPLADAKNLTIIADDFIQRTLMGSLIR